MSSDERIEQFLHRVCCHLRWPPYRARVRRELTDHILSRASYLMDERGFSEEEAVVQAVCLMGDPDALGHALQCDGRPLRRTIFLLLTCILWAGIVICLLCLLYWLLA